MVWRGTRRGSVYDGFGDEVGQQPIAGKRVVTAVVDVYRRALVVEDMQCVQRARFERLLEKWIALLYAGFERRAVVECHLLLVLAEGSRRVVLVRLQQEDVPGASCRQELIHHY